MNRHVKLLYFDKMLIDVYFAKKSTIRPGARQPFLDHSKWINRKYP